MTTTITSHLRIAGDNPPEFTTLDLTMTRDTPLEPGWDIHWGDRRFTVVKVEKIDDFTQRVSTQAAAPPPSRQVRRGAATLQMAKDAAARHEFLGSLRRRRGGY